MTSKEHNHAPLQLPDWTDGFKFQPSGSFPGMSEQLPTDNHLQNSVRRVLSTSQNADTYSHQTVLRDSSAPHADGLEKLPSATDAEFWLRKASALQAAQQPREAEKVLLEALERDIQPVTSVARALHELQKHMRSNLKVVEPLQSLSAAGSFFSASNPSTTTAAPAASSPKKHGSALKSLTPGRTGVKGQAIRIPARMAKTPGAMATAAVPPVPTNFTEVLKKLEFTFSSSTGVEPRVNTFDAMPATACTKNLETTTKRLQFDFAQETPLSKTTINPPGTGTHAAFSTALPSIPNVKGRRVTFGSDTVSPSTARPRRSSLAGPSGTRIKGNFGSPTPIIPELEGEGTSDEEASACGTVNSRHAGATPFDRRLSALFAKYQGDEEEHEDMDLSAAVDDGQQGLEAEEVAPRAVTPQGWPVTAKNLQEAIQAILNGPATATTHHTGDHVPDGLNEPEATAKMVATTRHAEQEPQLRMGADIASTLGRLLRHSLEDITAAETERHIFAPRPLLRGSLSPTTGMLSTLMPSHPPPVSNVNVTAGCDAADAAVGGGSPGGGFKHTGSPALCAQHADECVHRSDASMSSGDVDTPCTIAATEDIDLTPLRTSGVSLRRSTLDEAAAQNASTPPPVVIPVPPSRDGEDDHNNNDNSNNNNAIVNGFASSPSAPLSSCDGILRDSHGIPLVTPGTVTVRRGSSVAPSRGSGDMEGIAADLTRSFDTPPVLPSSTSPIKHANCRATDDHQQAGVSRREQPQLRKEACDTDFTFDTAAGAASRCERLKEDQEDEGTPDVHLQPHQPTMAPTATPTSQGQREMSTRPTRLASGSELLHAQNDQQKQQQRQRQQSSMETKHTSPTPQSRLGRAQRVPSATPPSATREVRSLMRDLSLKSPHLQAVESDLRAQGSITLAAVRVRASHRHDDNLEGEGGTSTLIATPVRRSGRVHGRDTGGGDPGNDTATGRGTGTGQTGDISKVLEAAEYAYSPNPLIGFGTSRSNEVGSREAAAADDKAREGEMEPPVTREDRLKQQPKKDMEVAGIDDRCAQEPHRSGSSPCKTEAVVQREDDVGTPFSSGGKGTQHGRHRYATRSATKAASKAVGMEGDSDAVTPSTNPSEEKKQKKPDSRGKGNKLKMSPTEANIRESLRKSSRRQRKASVTARS